MEAAAFSFPLSSGLGSDVCEMTIPSARLRPLTVGLASANPCWLSLMESEGLAWQPVSDAHGPDAPPELIIMPWETDTATRRLCSRLAAQGSTLISELRQPQTQPVSQTQSLHFPYHREDFSGLPRADLPEAVRVEHARCGQGTCYVLPFRLDRLWPSARVGKKVVVVDAEQDTRVWHRQAWVVKKNVRRVVMDVLRQAMFSRHLPVVHKWYWPGKNRSVFCLRADLDSGPHENLARYLDAVHPWARSASVFVCVGRCLDKADLIRKAAQAGLEVGSHTYSHMVFPDGLTNRRDATRAGRFLQAQGVEPAGLVAPAHFWHASMYAPLVAHGFRYASCFGLDHDNLPYYPVVKGRLQTILEIPSHCLGDFFPKFRIPLDGEAGRRFFDRLIAKKHAAAEPLHLYGHADMDGRLGAAPALVRFLCERALALPDVWTGHLADLASWWERRQKAVVHPWFDPARKRLVCETGATSAAMRDAPMLSVHLPDGSWRLVSIGACRPDGLDVYSVPARAPLQPPGATAVGEVTRSEEHPSLKDRVRARRVAFKRLAKAYVNIYLRQSEAGSTA